MPSHRVAVVVPQDFTLFELGVAVEIFAHARPELEREWYDVQVCTTEPGATSVVGGLFEVSIPLGLEAILGADSVIIPEADTVDRPANPAVLQAIAAAHARGARLISFCSGAFVLAAAGVLDGRTVATHWRYASALAARYPRVRVNADVLYIDDGQILTSAGTASSIDLSLHIIRKDHGAQVARRIARSLVVAPHREGGQAQFVQSPAPAHRAQPDGITRTLDFIVQNLDAELSIQDLANLAYMSTRNFSRRFREVTGSTPARWVLGQRLSRARRLLEETDIPIERIAQDTGFGSSVTMRQSFARTLRTSPSAYRRAFRTGFGNDLAS